MSMVPYASFSGKEVNPLIRTSETTGRVFSSIFISTDTLPESSFVDTFRLTRESKKPLALYNASIATMSFCRRFSENPPDGKNF